jgi:uncharacterized protein with von Willebrand factor type A (vWA) domain
MAPVGAAPVDRGADDADRLVVAFARSLRRAGLAVPIDATVAFAEALALVGLGHGARTYWAGRAVFVRRPEDVVVYDRVFAAFFAGLATGARATPTLERIAVLDTDDTSTDDADDDGPDADPDGDDVQAVRFSRVETLRTRDFAELTDADRADARRLLRTLHLHPPRRTARRLVPTGRARRHPDLRATVARSLRTDGELIQRRHRTPSNRPRRVVLLLDVSGSMEPYARELIRFLHTAVVARGAVEAFALGTRLTRLTRDLTTRDPDAAIAAAARHVVDWSGGTRLGDTLRTFNDEWGVRGMARGAVVVVLSDGWDRGDPQQLGAEMARLHRVAHRIVWVNPLKASPGYVPLAQGMAAALPYVDEFVEGHSIEALERVAIAIGKEER